MNESVSMLQPLSDALGISSTIIGIMMALCLMLVMSLFIYKKTMNVALSAVGLVIMSIMTTILGLLPLWTIPVVCCISGFIIYKHSYVDDNSIPYDDSMAESYRDRLVRAYEAKFGYSNPAFNEEVDAHIKAVEYLAKGYTRAVHRDKLKRLEKFVELNGKKNNQNMGLDKPQI